MLHKMPLFFRATAREEVGGEKKGKRESRTCVNREHAIVLRNEVRVCGIPQKMAEVRKEVERKRMWYKEEIVNKRESQRAKRARQQRKGE